MLDASGADEDQKPVFDKEIDVARDLRLVRRAHGGEAAVERERVFVGVVPRHRHAIERIFIALHRDLVAVIYRRDAGQHELQRRGDADARLGFVQDRAVETDVRPLLFGHRGRVEVCERVQRAHGVVSADQRHTAIERLFGIMVADDLDRVAEFAGVAALGVCEDRLFERIVHHAVELSAQQIVAAFAVADLVGRVLPDLADHGGVGVDALDRAADVADGLFGQLVDDVEPPALDAHRGPLFDDAALVQDEFSPALGVLVDGRADGHAPPAVIAVRPIVEAVPIVVFAALGLIGADGVVSAELVEVAAVRAGVVEHAVQDDGDAPLRRPLDQFAELVLGAEKRIDLEIVARVIAVVGRRLEDGRQIDRAYAERLEIVELVDDPLQIAAVEVVGAVHAVGVAQCGRLVPLLLHAVRHDA